MSDTLFEFIAESPNGRAKDIDLVNLWQGRIYLHGELDFDSGLDIIERCAYIAALQGRKGAPPHITLHINSGGGNLYSALSIIDYWRTLPLPVHTQAAGCAFSAACLLLMAGERGHRTATRNTGLMLHEFSGYEEGKYSDTKAAQTHSDWLIERLREFVKERSSAKSKAQINKIIGATDFWMTPAEAKRLGIIDTIL